MTKKFKKFTAIAAIAAIISTGAAFATETVETTAINYEPMTSSYEVINDVTMLPLRSVAEHFGYTVEWNDESQSVSLTKGAHYITFAINEDAYSFSRMAPQSLGTAPILFEGTTTYVPQSFFCELIGLNCELTEDGIRISIPNIVTVKEVTEDGALLVEDEVYGEVLVLINEETVVTVGGAPLSEEFVIEVGQALEVEYSEQMTRSIPPQTVAVSIEVLNLPVENEEVLTPAPVLTTVTAVNEDGSITVGEGMDEIIVFVTEETVITKNGEAVAADALTEGLEISVLYADFMTMSLPPQTAAVSIEIK